MAKKAALKEREARSVPLMRRLVAVSAVADDDDVMKTPILPLAGGSM